MLGLGKLLDVLYANDTQSWIIICHSSLIILDSFRMGNEIIWSDGANDESEGGGWKFIADPSITLKQVYSPRHGI